MSSNIRIQRICAQCGNEFTAKTTVTQTCSNKCRKAAYKARERNQKIAASNEQTLRIKMQPIEKLNGKQFLKVAEVAQLMDCSRRTAYRLVEKGILPGAVNLSERLTRVKRTELDKLFESIEQETKPQQKQYVRFRTVTTCVMPGKNTMSRRTHLTTS